MNINSYQELKTFLNEIKQLEPKPKLLIHSCCAPCSTHVLNVLSQYFKITIFYYNPNIYPVDEFQKRLKEQHRLIKEMHLEIEIVEGLYEYDTYLEKIKGLENSGERSQRCYYCYELRLKKTFEYAKKYNFDYYTTTLSISPYKNSGWINEIGFKYQSDRCQYVYSNFKKENGYQHSIHLAKKYGLYRQDYCGCEFSMVEHKNLQKKANPL